MGAYNARELATLQARTTSGEGSTVTTTRGEFDYPRPPGSARAFLNVTAASGTSPTLDVDIVVTINGEDYVLASFAQATAPGTQSIVIPDAPPELKAAWTIGGGSPSFTFEVHVARW